VKEAAILMALVTESKHSSKLRVQISKVKEPVVLAGHPSEVVLTSSLQALALPMILNQMLSNFGQLNLKPSFLPQD
jgi:hypothetical protein